MPITKSTSKAIAFGILCLVPIALGVQVVQAAQRPVYLLRSKCVDSGPGGVGRDSNNVSIGRAVYTSFFNLAPGNSYASITCNIRQNDSKPLFQTLQLGFGMNDSDGSSPPVTVNVYLDGKKTDATTVFAPAQARALSLDVSSVSNVSVEAVCSSTSQYCNQIYFFNASLVPVISSPTRSK